jgi:hypothetical protein
VKLVVTCSSKRTDNTRSHSCIQKRPWWLQAVKWLNLTKGYRFIQPQDGGKTCSRTL